MKQLKKRKKPSKLILDLWEAAGKLFFDMGKIMFGTLFLGGVLQGKMPGYILMIAGFTGTVVFFSIGLILTVVLIQPEEEKEEKPCG